MENIQIFLVYLTILISSLIVAISFIISTKIQSASQLNSSNPKLNNKYPLFSDIEEGFEKEIEFVKENVLVPFTNREIYEAGGVLTLPRGIFFKGNGAAELVVRALANEGGFYTEEINAKESLKDIQFYSEKRRKLENIFTKLKENSPSILVIHGGYISVNNGERPIFLKMMENISGKVLVIRVVPNEVTSFPKHAPHFSHIYEFPNDKLSPQKRKTILKLATKKWKSVPSDEILEKVAACQKFNSIAEIENLAYSVYEDVLKSNLKKNKNEIVTMEIDPSLEDWIGVIRNKFGATDFVQVSEKPKATEKPKPKQPNNSEQDFKVTEQNTNISEQKLKVPEQNPIISEQNPDITKEYLKISEEYLKISKEYLQISKEYLKITEQKFKISEQKPKVNPQNIKTFTKKIGPFDFLEILDMSGLLNCVICAFFWGFELYVWWFLVQHP